MGVMWEVKEMWWSIKSFPRNVLHKIKNLVIWFPIIWNDQQWDYSFLLRMMIKKLELMEDFYNSDAPLAKDSKIYAKEIHEAVEELKYISDAKNESEAFEPIHKKHLETYGDFTLENVLLDLNRKKTEEEKKNLSNMVNESEKLYEEHMGNFCKIFKDRIRWWWD